MGKLIKIINFEAKNGRLGWDGFISHKIVVYIYLLKTSIKALGMGGI